MAIRTSFTAELRASDRIMATTSPAEAGDVVLIHGAFYADANSGSWSLHLYDPTIEQAEALEYAATLCRRIVADRERVESLRAQGPAAAALLAPGDHSTLPTYGEVMSEEAPAALLDADAAQEVKP